MKKLLIVIAAIITLVMISCGGGGGGGIVTPITPKAEVNITILPSTNVNFGDKVDVQVSIKNAGSGILTTSKGETFQVVNNETKEFQLTENTTFTLEASNADGVKATTSKAVTVGSWKDNNFGLLTHNGKHWVVRDTQIYQDGELVYVDPNVENAGEYYIYDIDNTYYFYSVSNQLYGHNGWRFLENETQIQRFNNNGTENPRIIVTLTETDLSLSEVADFGDGGMVTIVRNWKIEE